MLSDFQSLGLQGPYSFCFGLLKCCPDHHERKLFSLPENENRENES